MPGDLDRLHEQARELGLRLSDEDLRAIQAILDQCRAGAYPRTAPESAIFDPPYRFVPFERGIVKPRPLAGDNV